MKQDLTEGSIAKKLIMYFLPIAAGTLFQQLYNAVDAIIVGKFVGTVALAAVGGSAANITNVLIGFFVALSGGCSVVIAQLFGAKDEHNLRRATGTAVAFCLISGLALSLMGWLLTPSMLRWLKAPDNTMTDAVRYLRIVFLGVTSQILYNIEAGILQAVGDSRSPFRYLLASCATNIVLDLLFVVVFHMGVTGVAVATVIAQLLSMTLATVRLMRSTEAYRIDVTQIRIDRLLLQKMLRIGVPAGLQSSMYSVSNMIMQIAINVLGTTVVAAWSLSGKIDGFYWACSSAACIALTNFIAQNYGAGQMQRVKDGFKLALKLFLCVTVGFSILLLTLGQLSLVLFTDDMAVVEATRVVMRWVVPFYFLWSLTDMLTGLLRGVGDAVNPVIICGIGTCLFRVLWIAIVFRLHPTLIIVCLSYCTSWFLTDLAFLRYYRKGKWRRKLTEVPDIPSESLHP